MRFKDGINNYLVHGQTQAVNPGKTGTKVSPHYQVTVAAGESAVIRLRLTNVPPSSLAETYPSELGDPFGSH